MNTTSLHTYPHYTTMKQQQIIEQLQRPVASLEMRNRVVAQHGFHEGYMKGKYYMTHAMDAEQIAILQNAGDSSVIKRYLDDRK